MVNLSITSYNPELAKFLLESAHRIFNETDTLSSEVISHAQINLRLVKTFSGYGEGRTKTVKL